MSERPATSPAERDEVMREVRRYQAVFAALLVFTVLTVLSARWMGQPGVAVSVAAIAVALAIAIAKASMVGSVFMHLRHERPFIYGLLVLTVVVLIGLLLGPALGHLDRMRS